VHALYKFIVDIEGSFTPDKPAFLDAATDTDILARMSARMSVSVSVSAWWNAGYTAPCAVCENLYNETDTSVDKT